MHIYLDVKRLGVSLTITEYYNYAVSTVCLPNLPYLTLCRETHIRVPLLLLFVLFCAYPIANFTFRRYYRHYRRRKKGLCLKCGYNLTGNVSGVCPECGEKI
ncbi:MAG: hypothetical protein JSV03_09325 [Planctomycetota bacterium]|nr:MAG: hypothetical protein JSV03_09325 [Planctomycetota bacterium]